MVLQIQSNKTCGSGGAHLYWEVRSGAVWHMVAQEPTSAGRRGPRPYDTWQCVNAQFVTCLDLRLVCKSTQCRVNCSGTGCCDVAFVGARREGSVVHQGGPWLSFFFLWNDHDLAWLGLIAQLNWWRLLRTGKTHLHPSWFV
jgi:hypothetical protein